MSSTITDQQKKEQDRIFKEAYDRTMAKVEKREMKKSLEDRVNILTDLFEQDLFNRDLTEAEKRELVAEFRNRIKNADIQSAKHLKIRKKRKLAGVLSAVMIAVISGLIYLNTYYPFTSISEIEKDLNYYIEKVDKGFGNYAETFYDTLDKYDLKLGNQRVDLFKERMYSELDEHCNELLKKVQEGELGYYDDLNDWVSFFPDREERIARQNAADNALREGTYKTLNEGVDKLIKGAGGILERTFDSIKKKTDSLFNEDEK